MALVNGTNYDHIDLQTTAGGDITRHMFQDSKAREDISELRNAVNGKADVDGYYEEMTVGDAEQLVATVGIQDKVPYLFRTSGGGADIGDRENDKIVGGTVAWNQLARAGTEGWTGRYTTVTFADGVLKVTSATSSQSRKLAYFWGQPNHVYFVSCEAKAGSDGNATALSVLNSSSLVAYGVKYAVSSTFTKLTLIAKPTVWGYISCEISDRAQSGEYGEFKNVQIIDLTKLLGPAIADYINSLETATPGAGVAWFRALFPKDYYAYDAGTLRSVQVSAHKMVGFNAYDNETGKALVIGGSEYEITGAYTGLSLGGETVTPADGKFTPAKSGEMTVTGGDGTTCIHLRWDGERDGEFEPYKAHVYPLDGDLVLRGVPKLDANNRLYYDGDVYESDGRVTRKYGMVDLGSLEWTYGPSGESEVYRFAATVSGIVYKNTRDKGMCSKYITYTAGGVDDAPDRSLIFGLLGDEVYIRDSAYTDAAAFKAAMSGVMLIYELAEPTAETAAPYKNPQIVDDFGTEQYIDAGNRDVAIPVGHDTLYRQNLRAKLEMAPGSPESNGDYLMRRSNGQNTYVAYTPPLPAAPGENGTYTLKCTVSGGTATLTWEAET